MGVAVIGAAGHVGFTFSLIVADAGHDVIGIEYNLNAPLKNDVITFMENIGFYPIKLVEEHYSKGDLIQEDWIFARN